MKINTIITYVLVYLLTGGHWNLLVPVRAGREGGKGSGSTPADAGSTGDSSSTTTNLRLFKNDGNNNAVEMKEHTDFDKKTQSNVDRYTFKNSVIPTKIMFGDVEIWKKGEHNVNDVTSVIFRSKLNLLIISDDNNTANFRKNNNDNDWKHLTTTTRSKASGDQNSQSSDVTYSESTDPVEEESAEQDEGVEEESEEHEEINEEDEEVTTVDPDSI